jgi:hydroxymethylpyrimidine pyrophosphatase-like HAD family hydrolase
LRRKALHDDLPISAAGEDEARMVMVALRHPRLGAEDLLRPATEAFAGVGSASFAGPSVVDVVPAGVAKADTAAAVLARLGCPPEATVAFGDMPNDLPLFAWAGWAAAVANAHPMVLEAADEIVAANDDDGVARTVARLFRGAGR